MLYTIADANWSPERPLPPLGARAGFYRMRASVVSLAAGRPVLAAAIRYDSLRGRVIAHRAGRDDPGGPWMAPATMNDLGAVTVLAPVPADLVREIGPAEIRLHSGSFPVFPRSHLRTPCGPGAGRRSVSRPTNRTAEPRTLLPIRSEDSQRFSPGPEKGDVASTVQPACTLRRHAPMTSKGVPSRVAKARRAGGRVLAVLTRKMARRDRSHVEFAETTRQP